MHVLRPIRETDLSGLVALARSIDGTLTTLPPDESFLRDRIDESLRAFSPRVKKPGGEVYLFVLEDRDTGELVGTSGIAARVGGFEPFYSYEIRTEHFEHKPLNISKDVGVLHLKQEHRGPTEIGSLYLRPDCRRGGLGRLLSLARFLFIAAYPQRFDTTVIAEMRGYIDQTGRSPFWEAVGRQFFEFDFYTADALSGLGNKAFIADLMPRHPIYIPLLPPDVQAAIGRVHHDTQPALALLQSEGFGATNEIDIFDAGPQVRAAITEIRTIRARRASRIVDVLTSAPAGNSHLLANDQLDFRACLGSVAPDDDGVRLPGDCLDLLSLKLGEQVSFAPLR
ncbi:MAG TPA: arginine N-succinyltransferase [Opitutaceae bacterium]